MCVWSSCLGQWNVLFFTLFLLSTELYDDFSWLSFQAWSRSYCLIRGEVWTYMKSSADNVTENVFQEISKFIFDIFFCWSFSPRITTRNFLQEKKKRKVAKRYPCLFFSAWESNYLIKDKGLARAIEQEFSFASFDHIV